jgi:hypothetical protein
MKTCIKCKDSKSLNEFHKDKNRKDELHPYCKICCKLSSAPYHAIHKEEAKERARLWYLNNKDKAKTRREQIDIRIHRKKYMKNWREKNQIHIKSYKKIYESLKCSKDINYKISSHLRKRLSQAIKNHQKSGSAINDLGCSIQELKIYLESKFYHRKINNELMTWNNWSRKGWHIDHIKPLSSFNLSDREQFLEACNYTNLQPLWSEENYHKSDSYSLV